MRLCVIRMLSATHRLELVSLQQTTKVRNANAHQLSAARTVKIVSVIRCCT